MWTADASLQPFTDATGVASSLTADVQRSGSGIVDLRYVLRADMSRVHVPDMRPACPTDRLWRHTCFEMFILKDNCSPGYYELNISPSSQWALYGFDAYHENMTPVSPACPPRVHVVRAGDRLEVAARVEFGKLPCSGAMALSAVIEDSAHGLTYWALKHPSHLPDFHHPDGFVLPSRGA